MQVEIGKKYVTRDGNWDVEVISIDNDYFRPVLVKLTHKKENWSHDTRYYLDGSFYLIKTLDSPYDLIEVPYQLKDYYAAFNVAWDSLTYPTPKDGHMAGIKAVLELAGVKV